MHENNTVVCSILNTTHEYNACEKPNMKHRQLLIWQWHLFGIVLIIYLLTYLLPYLFIYLILYLLP